MSKIKITAFMLSTMMIFSGCSLQNSEPAPNELITPQYSVEFIPPAIPFAEIAVEEIHQSGEVKTVFSQAPATVLVDIISVAPETVWEEDTVVTYNAFTLSEMAAFDASDCIGILEIARLSLAVNVYEADDEMEAMTRGAAHFKSTSAWDGNIGVSAHNVNFDGSDGFFKNLYQLKSGDTISYTTALGNREYSVQTIKTISDDDWSYLNRSTQNKLTLITCISGQSSKRLVIQAVEK